jgi:acyl carrier protein
MNNRDETLSRLTRVFYEIFDDESIILSNEMAAKDLEEWDSLNHITLVLAVEKEFGVLLNAAEVGTLENVGQMLDLLVARASK